jgi:ABC-type sulfate transport system substrate-binding protein
MEGEPSMPEGLLGTVAYVDDIGQVHVSWENGSNLALNVDADRFQVVSRPSLDKGMSR